MTLVLNKCKYSILEIAAKRSEIAQRFVAASANISDGNITRMSPRDLALLFELYDQVFLENWFAQCFRGIMKFSLSSRLTKSAGKTLCPKNIRQQKPENVEIEIRMGVNFFFQYDAVKGIKTVSGIATHNSLEALQLVFEHELCHVLEFLHYYQSNCNGQRFKTIAHNLFGHTESYHKLPTQRQIAQEKYGFKIGDIVTFMFEGRVLSGILYNIQKRAVVMVKDQRGQYIDKSGIRYNKYYVPIKILSILGNEGGAISNQVRSNF